MGDSENIVKAADLLGLRAVEGEFESFFDFWQSYITLSM